MTTNKPGSVDQNPCYDCAGCYDYQTHRAEDLRVHKDHAWCESCWDYRRDGDEALPLWHELERFVPALQAECEKLRWDAERYRWLRDPCSGAERVVLYGRGDYGRGLMTYTMLDKAIDAAMEPTK